VPPLLPITVRWHGDLDEIPRPRDPAAMEREMTRLDVRPLGQ
jgi:hypothetical protein